MPLIHLTMADNKKIKIMVIISPTAESFSLFLVSMATAGSDARKCLKPRQAIYMPPMMATANITGPVHFAKKPPMSIFLLPFLVKTIDNMAVGTKKSKFLRMRAPCNIAIYKAIISQKWKLSITQKAHLKR